MLTDRLIIEFDRALRTLATPARSTRATPGHELPEAALDDSQRQEAIGLMRVNHCGEVCAQALYQGQALTSRQPAVRAALQQAADEETGVEQPEAGMAGGFAQGLAEALRR